MSIVFLLFILSVSLVWSEVNANNLRNYDESIKYTTMVLLLFFIFTILGLFTAFLLKHNPRKRLISSLHSINSVDNLKLKLNNENKIQSFQEPIFVHEKNQPESNLSILNDQNFLTKHQCLLHSSGSLIENNFNNQLSNLNNQNDSQLNQLENQTDNQLSKSNVCLPQFNKNSNNFFIVDNFENDLNRKNDQKAKEEKEKDEKNFEEANQNKKEEENTINYKKEREIERGAKREVEKEVEREVIKNVEKNENEKKEDEKEGGKQVEERIYQNNLNKCCIEKKNDNKNKEDLNRKDIENHQILGTNLNQYEPLVQINASKEFYGKPLKIEDLKNFSNLCKENKIKKENSIEGPVKKLNDVLNCENDCDLSKKVQTTPKLFIRENYSSFVDETCNSINDLSKKDCTLDPVHKWNLKYEELKLNRIQSNDKNSKQQSIENHLLKTSNNENLIEDGQVKIIDEKILNLNQFKLKSKNKPDNLNNDENSSKLLTLDFKTKFLNNQTCSKQEYLIPLDQDKSFQHTITIKTTDLNPEILIEPFEQPFGTTTLQSNTKPKTTKQSTANETNLLSKEQNVKIIVETFEEQQQKKEEKQKNVIDSNEQQNNSKYKICQNKTNQSNDKFTLKSNLSQIKPKNSVLDVLLQKKSN